MRRYSVGDDFNLTSFLVSARSSGIILYASFIGEAVQGFALTSGKSLSISIEDPNPTAEKLLTLDLVASNHGATLAP